LGKTFYFLFFLIGCRGGKTFFFGGEKNPFLLLGPKKIFWGGSFKKVGGFFFPFYCPFWFFSGFFPKKKLGICGNKARAFKRFFFGKKKKSQGGRNLNPPPKVFSKAGFFFWRGWGKNFLNVFFKLGGFSFFSNLFKDLIFPGGGGTKKKKKKKTGPPPPGGGHFCWFGVFRFFLLNFFSRYFFYLGGTSILNVFFGRGSPKSLKAKIKTGRGFLKEKGGGV